MHLPTKQRQRALVRTRRRPLTARPQVLGNAILAGLAMLVGPVGCSLVFSASPEGVADSGPGDVLDAGVASDDDGRPRVDAGDGVSTIDCGSMSALPLNLLTPEDLAPSWSLSGRSAEFGNGNMGVDTAGWMSVDSVVLRGLSEYAAPYALDIHVSQIPDEASARFILRFEYNDDTLDLVQVAITASQVRIFSSNAGGTDVSDRLAPAGGATDYYIRMMQADGTLEIEESLNGLQWRQVETLSVPDLSARPTIAALVSDDVVDPHPPMILHSLGSSCQQGMRARSRAPRRERRTRQ